MTADGLLFLLRHLPPGLHLAPASRSDAPLSAGMIDYQDTGMIVPQRRRSRL